jgi:acyl-CoA thioesterase
MGSGTKITSDDSTSAEPDLSSPQLTASACAERMWSQDKCSQDMGMNIESVAPGEAVLSMVVKSDMLNGQHCCHGGVMFTLADSAFAFACNAYNQITVGQHCSIDFVKPAYEHDRLVAYAAERWREGRSGIYDVEIKRGEELIAVFRGNSRTVHGQMFETDSPSSD